MAPMTRSRAIGNIPNKLMTEYYFQRAGAGLIITEGTAPTPDGLGYPRIPGIFSQEQMDGWKDITAAVHKSNSKIFLQLMHTGRIGHNDNLPDEVLLAGPSEIKAAGQIFTDIAGLQDHSQPTALTTEGVKEVISGHVTAAKNAIKAGFDGIELHGANGYLLDQFLRDGSNQRADAYGGTIQNRARFPLEVVEGVLDVWDPQQVGYKLSPHFAGYSMSDSNPVATFSYLAKELNKRRLAYLHIGEAIAGPMAAPAGTVRVTPLLREIFSGTLIANGGYDAHSANAVIARGEADLVAFGVPFLANPDLPARYWRKAPLNSPDYTTFYAGEEKGYVDYPALA